MRKKVISLLLALCLAVSLLPVCAQAAGSANTSLSVSGDSVGGFRDVKQGDYFADAVQWAVREAITNGTSADTFSPNSTCTRAQIITFLWRAAGAPEPWYATPFADVRADAYYAEATAWAAENGMADGSAFFPDAYCTREMAVEFMWKYAGSPAVSVHADFADVSSPAVDWALERGVTNGTSALTFSPGGTCTRGQIVTFLYRAFALPAPVITEPEPEEKNPSPEPEEVQPGPSEPEPEPEQQPEPSLPSEQEVYSAMTALKSQYPEGTPWDNGNSYEWNGGIYGTGYGCAGFAFLLSDAAFGTLPAKKTEAPVRFADVRVGDILRINHDTHSVIVLEVRDDSVVIAEGNYNSSVHWGRVLTAAEVEQADWLMTRW